MKKIVALACCACAVPAWAADVGIGASAESNDSTIYVPIDFGTTWRLEPFVNYTKLTTKTSGYTLDDKALRIGTGIFGLKSIGESMRFYYGGRLAYLDISSETDVYPVGIVERSGNGYRVAPTVGFEYLFNEHISLGGEAEYYFEDIDRAGLDQERSGTDTRLILRFRF